MCFGGYSEEKNGYRSYNPLKKKIGKQGCNIDELGNWYNPKENVETDEVYENEDRDKFENGRDCHGSGNNFG